MATLLTSTSVFAAPPAQPLPMRGSCPWGYANSGSYCVPTSGAAFAIERNGGCPIGYQQRGNYCLAGSDAKHAMPRAGACPMGYDQSGNYCVSMR